MAIEEQHFVQNLETQIDNRNHQHQIDKIKTQSTSIRTKSTLKKKVKSSTYRCRDLRAPTADPPVSASDERRFWGLHRRQSQEVNGERESEREKKNKRRKRALAERARLTLREAERG